MALTLLQKVFISAQELYKENVSTFTTQMLYDKFLQLDFYTPDKDWPRAMARRMFELMSCWYATVYKRDGKFVTYKLTHSWRHAKANKIHLSYIPVFRDNKEHDMPKRLKKENTDKMRTSREVIEVKSENKVLNTTLIDKKAPPIDSEYMNWKFVYDITNNINISKWESIVVTMKDWKITHIDIFKKRTLLQQIKSLFWF